MADESAPPVATPDEGADAERPATPEKPAKPVKTGKTAKGAGKPAKTKGSTGKTASARGRGEDGRLTLTLAEHPRAVRGIARAKAWGGLAGFLLGGYLSLPTDTLPAVGLRALAAGAVCYVAAWGAAVFLWRRLVVAELRDAQQQQLAAEIARLNPPRTVGAETPATRGRPRTPAGA